CAGPNPTWSLLGGGPIDSNLGGLAFASADDEPRPVAVKVGSIGGPAGGNIFVAYFTGAGTSGTTTASGQTYCFFSVAQWNGAGWNFNQPEKPSGFSCDASMTTGIDFGRHLALEIDPVSGGPMVA